MKIVITGAGVISAIGLDKASTVASLQAQKSGIGPLKQLHTRHSDLPCGEVDLSDDEMKSRLGIDATASIPRTSLLGIIAVKEALRQAGIDAGKRPMATAGSGCANASLGCVLVNGTTVGGMDITERTYPKIDTSRHDCGGCTDMIADYFGIFGQKTTISTACSSAANAIIFGSELIKAGRADIVLAGGSESLTKYHLNGFNTLMILDSQRCRPFDSSRAGLNLGEGAGFVVLESEEHARARGAKALAEVSGYANACDAFHQTATSPEGTGAGLAMSQAIEMAGLKPSDIDYVNAHGTGTPNNDATESAALKRIFGDALPPVSSTKSYTGHTTSASGGIETVICLEVLKGQFLPTNLGWENADPDCISPYIGAEVKSGCPAANAVNLPSIRNILCNSFGFGGNDTALVLSLPDDDDSTTVPCNSEDASQHPEIKVVVRAARYIEGADFEWKHLLNPMKARRMGTLMRRTLVCSLEALQQAGATAAAAVIPDAVITATGLGCMENSEKFLTAMLDSGETMMSPTDFMQSTHNTPGSLISIHLGDHGYNSTYSQVEYSLASALMDAFLQLKSGRIRTALVGAHDEITPATEGYPVPDGSLALVLEAVPATGTPESFLKTGATSNRCPEIVDVEAIAPLGARYLYNAITGLENAPCETEQKCGPVVLKSR